MTQSHFNYLAGQICFQLSKASHSISAAVCWFSHADIFEVLKDKLRAGVRVELLLEFDTQNIRDRGLDFQSFIDLGGVLFGHKDLGLMHHKFAIIDHKLLLTGSFNWTYNSNAENLLVTDERSVLTEFQREFERQRNAAKRVFSIKKEEAKPFVSFPFFENSTFQKIDLRKRVAGGCTIWIVRSDKIQFDESRIINDYILPFDPQLLLTYFWSKTPLFDRALFEGEWKSFSCGLSPMESRNLRLFTFRMKPGDIVLMVEKKKQLRIIGIIQSEPKPYKNEQYSTIREVLWLNISSANTPGCLQKKGFLPAVGRFRGSGLCLLEEIFYKTE
jgi:hypothetical protein